MNPLTFFQEDLEDQQELLLQLPKLSRDTKRAVIDDLLETYVAARVRNPSRTKVERNKTAPPVPGEYMDEKEAAAYLRLAARQLRDLCRDQNISHARIPDVPVSEVGSGRVVFCLPDSPQIALRLKFRAQESSSIGKKAGAQPAHSLPSILGPLWRCLPRSSPMLIQVSSKEPMHYSPLRQALAA
jgi:hypothetical protein